ncbi:MAG: hypothetical protein LZF86_50092 [Nitrospira sp.]|nr:MAG: hypothetical protein LZF86_50092 [Nitrospira sp.]
MDWFWLVGFLLLFLAGGGAYYLWQVVAAQTQDDFRAQQPMLRVTNLSAMHAGAMLTLMPQLENVGRGVAYDCVLHLGGWEGSFAVKKMYPPGPRSQKHTASLVLGPETPLRVKQQSNGYLRVSYRDQWGLKYDCWYPVTQSPGSQPPLYNIHIDLEHPDVNEPAPSFWEMRRLLRKRGVQD